MGNQIKLISAPINKETLGKAIDALTCCFDLKWNHILFHNREIEIDKESWTRAALSSELFRGFSLREMSKITSKNVLFKVAGNIAPEENLYPNIAQSVSIICEILNDDSSSRALFFDLFNMGYSYTFYYDGDKIRRFDQIQWNDAKSRVSCFHDWEQRGFLIGTNEGLWRTDENIENPELLFPAPQLTWIYRDLKSNYYFGTLQHGVFVSRNAGESWAKISALPVDRVNSIAVDNEKGLFFINTKIGIFLSQDAGKSWSLLSQNLQSDSVTFLHYQPEYSVLFMKTRKNEIIAREF